MNLEHVELARQCIRRKFLAEKRRKRSRGRTSNLLFSLCVCIAISWVSASFSSTSAAADPQLINITRETIVNCASNLSTFQENRIRVLQLATFFIGFAYILHLVEYSFISDPTRKNNPSRNSIRHCAYLLGLGPKSKRSCQPLARTKFESSKPHPPIPGTTGGQWSFI